MDTPTTVTTGPPSSVSACTQFSRLSTAQATSGTLNAIALRICAGTQSVVVPESTKDIPVTVELVPKVTLDKEWLRISAAPVLVKLYSLPALLEPLASRQTEGRSDG